jgi:hypothetical protein
MYEQRVFWANTRQKPNTIWASAIDDFQNFEYGVDDSDAFVITLAATEQNGIMWMDSLRRFHVSTKSRDFSITGGEQDGAPVSATVYNIRSESVSGATNAQPVVVNDALLFVARHGVRIHELAYSLERDGYIGNDISMLAPQLLEAGVLEIAYARQPDPVLYCLCRDGSLAAFTYAPAEKVNAWSRVKLAGKSLKAEDLKAETNQTSPNLQPSALQAFSTSLPVSGICVLPGALGDELWVCAAGVVMRMGTDRGVEAGVHLDCALIVTGRALHDWGVFADDLSYPFEKFDVVVFHSGGQRVHFKDLGFSENGALYFPGDAVKNAERCVIGLPYSGELETLPVDAVFQSGPAAGTIRRIVRVTPNFFETVSCRMGRRGVIPPVNFRNTADRMDALNAPFSGYTMPLTWPAGSSRDETIRVVQDLPFPCTLLGLAVDWEVMG